MKQWNSTLKPGKGFKSKLPERKPAKQIGGTYKLGRPRETACRIEGLEARCSVPVPKFAYVRDDRLRDMCRAMPCQHCGISDGTVTWAHSNQAIHGKAKGMKASDLFVAALCFRDHFELDQGHDWPQDMKVRIWNNAHRKTVALALREGLWPAGVPVPEWKEE